MKELTSRQAECLQVIRDYQAEHGYAPTIREIGDRMGITSTNGVKDHMIALEKKGYIRCGTAQARAVVLTDSTAPPAPEPETGETWTAFLVARPSPGQLVVVRACTERPLLSFANYPPQGQGFLRKGDCWYRLVHITSADIVAELVAAGFSEWIEVRLG